MILSSACQPQADPFPAPSGRHGERRSYTTPRDTISKRVFAVISCFIAASLKRGAGWFQTTRSDAARCPHNETIGRKDNPKFSAKSLIKYYPYLRRLRMRLMSSKPSRMRQTRCKDSDLRWIIQQQQDGIHPPCPSGDRHPASEETCFAMFEPGLRWAAVPHWRPPLSAYARFYRFR